MKMLLILSTLNISMVIMMMTMFMLSMTWMARVLWWVTHCDTVSSEDIEETKKCRVDGSHSDCHRPISDDDDCHTDDDDDDYDDDDMDSADGSD